MIASILASWLTRDASLASSILKYSLAEGIMSPIMSAKS